MANIKCPACGELNSDAQEFCQYCQMRLQPLTGPLKGTDAPIQAGDIPTRKRTADLEPNLPQWLREVRDQSRNITEEDAIAIDEPVQTPQPADQSLDLLAGLQSQAEEDEEEIPEWLANITGVESKKKKGSPEPSELHWVELGRPEDFPQEETPSISATQSPTEYSTEGGLPPWLASAQSAQNQEWDELSDWLSQARKEAEAEKPAAFKEAGGGEPAASEQLAEPIPDWLKNLQAEQPELRESETPAPFDSLRAVPFDDAPSTGESTPAWMTDSTPETSAAESEGDWLKRLQAQAEQSSTPEPRLSGAQDALSQSPERSEGEGVGEESPKWEMPSLPTEEKNASTEEQAIEVQLPDWLKAAAPKSTFDEPISSEEPGLGEVPDWLKTITSQPPVIGEESSVGASPSTETPDWQTSTPPSPSHPSEDVVEQRFKATEEESAPAFSTEAFSSEETASPAFTEDALSTRDMETLFTEMPDWLSSAGAEQASSEATPSAAGGAQAVSPEDLPSWVQAMRPVESSIAQSGEAGEQTLETRGALAGLHGVLPAAPGAEPSGKPKAYSIKLHTTEEQQTHAALLEKILEAEITPAPIVSTRPMAAQNLLRWGIAALLLLILIGALLGGTQFFRLPVSWPTGTTAALQIVEAIPENAPVLIIVDYEPARVAEMEAAAAPLLDHMILLRHPRLTFVSTSPTGPLLAERLISEPLSGHNYQRGVQYSNLGYLPGGLAGVLAFAQNPSLAKPLDVDSEPAWGSPPLQGISLLSNFAALLVVTDNADSARAWIEQAGPYRGAASLVMVSSAQAAPMIQPYYQSQQINGYVNGLYGGAILEQNNAGRPGLVRAYWDAYSLGLLFAMAVIVGGGLWNLALGLREHAVELGK